MRFLTLLATVSTLFALSACGGGGNKSVTPAASSASQSAVATNVEAINQQTPCFVDDHKIDVVDASCQPGQKVVFMPPRWGNEQLPIVFAGLNCDLRYAVVSNNGGVTCIRARRAPPAHPAQEASAASK